MKIEDLKLNWTEKKRVNTKRGPKDVQEAVPTPEFWDAWADAKEDVRAAGLSLGRHYKTNEWTVTWWQDPPAEEVKAREESLELSRAASAYVDVPRPEGLEYLPYQRAGVAYASARQNCLIADEMGLGKTIQAIGVFNADPSLRKVLIICPATLRLNWAREWEKWSTRLGTVHVVKNGSAAAWDDSADVVVLNYDILSKHKVRIDAAEWDLLIVDEAHYVKNPKAIRTKQLLGHKPKKNEKPVEPIRAKRRLFLTGTPILNRPVELWPLIESLDPEDLGQNFFKFAKRYCGAVKNRFGWDFSGATNLGELQDRLRAKVMVRRLKADVLTELPAKRRQVIELSANGAAGAIKRERDEWAKHEAVMDDLHAAVELAKASDDPADYERAVNQLKKGIKAHFESMSEIRSELAIKKVPYIVEHIRDCLESGPVVLGVWHRDLIARLLEEFPEARALSGDTPMAERQQMVDDFQAGKFDLFVGQIKAAGVGITLTRSSHVVLAELPWTPGDASQFEDRCHRIGQDDSVLVQYLVLEGSLDSTMAKALVAKQDVIDKALDKVMADEPIVIRDSATQSISRAKIEEEAAEITPEQSKAVTEALRRLAGMCDGAQAIDGRGFNKLDTMIGKSLAEWPRLTPRQAVLGRKIVLKYRRQLPTELVETIRGKQTYGDGIPEKPQQ